MLRRRWFPWIVFAATLLSAGPLALLLYFNAPKPGDPGVTCGGIGFGEVPCGWDAVGLVFLLTLAPFVVVLAAVLLLSEFFGPRLTPARSILALIGLALPWIGVVVLLAVGVFE